MVVSSVRVAAGWLRRAMPPRCGAGPGRTRPRPRSTPARCWAGRRSGSEPRVPRGSSGVLSVSSQPGGHGWAPSTPSGIRRTSGDVPAVRRSQSLVAGRGTNIGQVADVGARAARQARPMTTHSRGGGVLVVALGIDSLGNGLFLPLSLVYFLELTDVPLGLLGVLLSLANAITLPLPILVGSVADRIGPLPVVIASQRAGRGLPRIRLGERPDRRLRRVDAGGHRRPGVLVDDLHRDRRLRRRSQHLAQHRLLVRGEQRLANRRPGTGRHGHRAAVADGQHAAYRAAAWPPRRASRSRPR